MLGYPRIIDWAASSVERTGNVSAWLDPFLGNAAAGYRNRKIPPPKKHSGVRASGRPQGSHYDKVRRRAARPCDEQIGVVPIGYLVTGCILDLTTR